jgi:DNA mismatch repair protein MSH5
MTVGSYVANDTLVVGGCGGGPPDAAAFQGPQSSFQVQPKRPTEGPSMLLLTGPNYSGKSVYLKQVGVGNRLGV